MSKWSIRQATQNVANRAAWSESDIDRPHEKRFSGKRILIAEDHKMMREGLRALLKEKLGYECVDEADDGYAAVNKAKVMDM